MLISKTDKSLWMPFDSAEDDPGFVSRFSFSCHCVLLDREESRELKNRGPNRARHCKGGGEI
jgi:hypothetical protein